MEASRLDLPAAMHLPVKQQRGFQVRDELGPVKFEAPRLFDRAASSKSLVGFKGLLDVAVRGSMPPVGGEQEWGYPVVGHVEVVGTAHSTPAVRRMVKSVMQGMRACQDPEASAEGLGGTYFFMNDQAEKVAIMKPCDEEPLAPNNPKGFVGRALGDPGLKPTVRVGEAAMREVAAYLLDHDHFANVPCTVLVRLTHPIFHVAPDAASSAANTSPQQPAQSVDSTVSSTAGSLAQDLLRTGSSPVASHAPRQRGIAKLGSLQEFVRHNGDTSEQGASRFSTAHVHRIGILDLRLLNTDRHAGNMLCEHPSGSEAGKFGSRFDGAKIGLVPIDHGFCLPEALEPPFFEWLHWPQAMIPFDEGELAYIEKLDPEADCELLQRELPWLRKECLRTLTVATTILKAGAAAGLSLSEIGNVLSRPLVGIDEEPSELEKLCTAAHAQVRIARSASVAAQLAAQRWSSDDAWDALLHQDGYSDADTGTPHVLEDVQEEGDDMLFDLEEDSSMSGLQQVPASPFRADSMLGMPLHSGALSSAKHLPVSAVSPSSVSPASPQRIRAQQSYQQGEPSGGISRRSTSTSTHSRDSSTNTGASTIGPRGSEDSLGSREASIDYATVQGQMVGKPSMDAGASSPEAPFALPAQSLASGMWMRPGGRGARQRAARRHAAGAAGCKPPALGMGAGLGGHAYPPPVEGAAPSGDTNPLAGLTVQEWPMFLAMLQNGICQALQDGRWRSDPAPAMRGAMHLRASCPRF